MIAALVGLGGGVGVVLYLKARKEAAASGASACEVACVAAARAAGVTGDLSTTCKGACNLAGPVLGAYEKYVTTVGSKTAGALTNNGMGKLACVAGKIFHPFGGFDCSPKTVCTSCCPPGTKADFTMKSDAQRALDSIVDHRGGNGASIGGAVCRDAKGAIVGTLPATGGYKPWKPSATPPPPPAYPGTSSGGSSRGPSGGVTVGTGK